MIKVEKIDTWGFEHAIRGMRNAKNSWDKSDSTFTHYPSEFTDFGCIIGENDLQLMQKLYNGGSEHRKYLRDIHVSMDITAPMYWWKEFDTYKIGVTRLSCSTMHTIHKKEFELDDFSHEHLDYICQGVLLKLIDYLNSYREDFLETNDKDKWWQMIQLLPSSYNQKATIDMNYENVVNIIRQRENHKLDEWNVFCDKLKHLPYIKELLYLELVNE